MDIKINFKEGFGKTAKVLNNKQRDKLADLVVLLKDNPYHPKLTYQAAFGKARRYLRFSDLKRLESIV